MKNIVISILASIGLLSFDNKKNETIVTDQMAFEWSLGKVNEEGFYINATPEFFGWTPDSSVEFTNATLQSIFDTTVNAVLSTQTYNTSVQLDIDTISGQTITGNGAIIQATGGNFSKIINIDKRTSNAGKTIITDLTVDGNNGIGQIGFQIYSAVEFTNVDVHGMYQHGVLASSAGIWLELYNDDDSYAYGDWIFEDCEIYDITADGDTDPFNADGGADGVLVFHREIVSPSNAYEIKYQNGIIRDCWGAGGQNIGLFSPSLDVTNQGASITFENVDIYGWERRSVKAFCGNLTFKNVTITEPSATDPNLTNIYQPAGMFVFAANSGATGAGNILIENCTFNGNGGTLYERDFVILTGDGIEVNNVTLTNGVNFDIGGDLANLTVCSLDMSAGGSIRENNDLAKVDGGGIIFDTDNIYPTGSPFSNITTYTITEQDLSCPNGTPPPTQTTTTTQFFNFFIH